MSNHDRSNHDRRIMSENPGVYIAMKSAVKTLLLMDLLCMVGIGFCFVLLLFSPFVQ